MKILGKAYKENPIILAVGFSIIIIILITASILFFIFFPDTTIFGIIFSIFSLGMIILFIVIMKISLTSKVDILLYDEENKSIIIHKYTKTISIKLDEIKELKYHNKTVSNIGPIFLPMEVNYGEITFYLKNGSKIKTHPLEDVLSAYYELEYLRDTYMD